MKITALEEYGLRCMLLLAKNEGGRSLTLPEISVSEGISVPYAAKLLMILKQAGLVKAARGRRGGYVLARPARKIYLKEIFNSLGEPVFTSTYCSRHSGDLDLCVHLGKCEVRPIWEGLDKFISDLFDKISLADLVFRNYAFLESLVSRQASVSFGKDELDAHQTS